MLTKYRGGHTAESHTGGDNGHHLQHHKPMAMSEIDLQPSGFLCCMACLYVRCITVGFSLLEQCMTVTPAMSRPHQIESHQVIPARVEMNRNQSFCSLNLLLQDVQPAQCGVSLHRDPNFLHIAGEQSLHRFWLRGSGPQVTPVRAMHALWMPPPYVVNIEMRMIPTMRK